MRKLVVVVVISTLAALGALRPALRRSSAQQPAPAPAPGAAKAPAPATAAQAPKPAALPDSLVAPRLSVADSGSLKGPRQPIFFRHDIHAGQYKMQCQYCHYSVAVSSEPGIPSLQTCMGCHLVIAGSDSSSKTEIKKVRQHGARRSRWSGSASTISLATPTSRISVTSRSWDPMPAPRATAT